MFSFDIKQYLKALRLWIMPVILLTVAGGLAGMVYCNVLAAPQYQSVSKVYVLSRSGEENSFTAYDLQAGGLLTKDYAQILTGMETARRVIGRLHLTDEEGNLLGYADFINCLDIEALDETRVVTVRVSHPDPYAACDIADAVQEAAMEQLREVVNEDVVSFLQHGNIPTGRNVPVLSLYVLAGAAGAGAAAALVILLILICRGGQAANTGSVILRRGVSAALLALIAVLMLFRSNKRQNLDLAGPEISIADTQIVYQDGAPVETLLTGVTAADEKDGDCTGSIRISGIFPQDGGRATVIYTAKDKDQNISVAERQIDYKTAE